LPTVFDHLVDAGSDRQAWLVERLEPWVRRGGWEKAAPVLASLLLRPSEDAITSQLLSAYLAGLRGGGHRLDPLLAELPAEPRARWAQLREQALGRAADGRLSAKTRRQALPVALAIDDARSRGLAWELLRGGEPQFVSAAVRAICREPVPATQIVAELKRLPPRAAATLVSTAATSDHAAAALVRAVDRGELDGRLIPPQAWQQLVRHTLPEIGQLATQLRRRQTRDDRAALVRDYLAAMDRLADPADAASGKRTFGEHCANCHRVDGVGVEVGPTISDLRTQTSAQLVEAILHPNAAIDADYFRYRVLTVDGRVAEGRLIGGDEAALTLELAGGQRLTVRRDAIEQFEATGQSLMPEGFEAQLDPRQLRDLVHYLKTWRIEALR
jgi:putative heme-binding domain-containing protein